MAFVMGVDGNGLQSRPQIRVSRAFPIGFARMYARVDAISSVLCALLQTSVFSTLSSPGVASQQNNLSVGTKHWLRSSRLRAECRAVPWKATTVLPVTFETQRFLFVVSVGGCRLQLAVKKKKKGGGDSGIPASRRLSVKP